MLSEISPCGLFTIWIKNFVFIANHFKFLADFLCTKGKKWEVATP